VRSTGESRERILVVEDDLTSARMVRDYLEAHGYAITLAATGTDGLACFEREPPDLMIVDVALPKKSGFELCRDVKQTAHGRQMPVLLMSAVYRDGDHAAEVVDEALRAQDYPVKPFDLKELLARVRALLA
jgi:two-component system OmpR family response regulator/two-component system alkaline phosphatase synthesis response regulator PhoP